ncbi:RNA-guided endonuclease IscB [Streptomyces dysideae]|uniref:RNA-guided endonuclease IscB n=1 Tax=Streptomyces dysideae TaxID=909626 RepID=UPI001F1AC18A|nr:RNA-guided endonuclease IscB [Streptomyces dysideae]
MDETGAGRHNTAAGTGHVRGETLGSSPAAERVTSDRSVREKGREAHPYVFVLDKHGAPLQPCSSARARKLLRAGRAVVHRHTPFVIRLKDRTVAESVVDGVEIGIDPGSRHTGIAVFTAVKGERRGRFALQLDHRGATVHKNMLRRAAFRRRRRVANLRYRAPRFNNRAVTPGWLPPSLRHRVDTSLAWMERLTSWAPVRTVHMERAVFDTHALTQGKESLDGIEYQQGTLVGYEAREYLLTKWRHACAYCGATGVPLNIDHIRPRSRGGTDRISNLTLACIPCNQAKGNAPVEEFLAHSPQRLAKILAEAKAPLTDAAAVNSTRWALWRGLDARWRTHVSSGGRTKWNRIRNFLPKTHALDALAVGTVDAITRHPLQVLTAGCTGRGTYTRTRTDKHGFPRLRLPRKKTVHGFQTGDFVRAVVPTGKKAGTHTGRVAVRTKGSFNITTRHGTVQSIHHRHVRLLQRADGYTYTTEKETGRPQT